MSTEDRKVILLKAAYRNTKLQQNGYPKKYFNFNLTYESI